MTKLTTERLEEIAKLEITEFSNGMDIAKDAYQSVGSSEIVLMARQLLAYEQAAEHPAARITWDGSEFSVSNVSEDFLYGGTAVYLAPVLPKQPELVDLSQQVEILNKILNWILKELPVPTQKASAMAIRLSSVINVISDLEVSAPAQPIIPERLIQAINRLLDNDGSRGCFDALEQHRAKTELELLLAAAQQNEPKNIPENIPEQPVSELRARAISLYKPPFKFDFGYIWDADGQMVADQNLNEDGQILRVRGWGRISYLENPEALQDEVGEVIALALSNYWNLHIAADLIQPVSEPYKLPDGWVMVPQQIFLDASDIESICSQCGDGHKSGYGDFTDGLLWVGDIQCDNGTIMHGLHISSSDYQEEGGLTLAEFKAPVQESE